MKSLIIFIVLLFVLSACRTTDIQDQQIINAQMPDKPLTFLALGDSYTIGEAVVEELQWPVQLVKQLNDEGGNIANPQVIAKTGWTTAELQVAIESETPTIQAPYDLVSLLIGVNNQYRGYDFQIYEKEFEELLLKAISFADGNASKVFVVSIPDYGVTPFATSKNPEKIALEIDQYNATAQAIANRYQVQFINITAISRQAATNRTLVASDGLHPSGKMYTEWVTLVKPIVKAILK